MARIRAIKVQASALTSRRLSCLDHDTEEPARAAGCVYGRPSGVSVRTGVRLPDGLVRCFRGEPLGPSAETAGLEMFASGRICRWRTPNA